MSTLLQKILVLVFCISTAYAAHSGDVYRKFLADKIAHQKRYSPLSLPTTPVPSCIVPKYVIPKGNIFCRMEDKLTKATGIWIKVGVK